MHTVTITTNGTDVRSLIRQINNREGFCVSQPAKSLLHHMVKGDGTDLGHRQFTIMFASVRELTSKDKVSWHELSLAIEGLGGQKCPAELGLYLRLQYIQPEEGFISLFMEVDKDTYYDGDCAITSILDLRNSGYWQGLGTDPITSVDIHEFKGDEIMAFVMP